MPSRPRYAIIHGVEMTRPPLSTRYGPCAACKAFIAERDGYYKTATGEGSRTLLCGKCADRWAGMQPARGAVDLFSDDNTEKEDY